MPAFHAAQDSFVGDWGFVPERYEARRLRFVGAVDPLLVVWVGGEPVGLLHPGTWWRFEMGWVGALGVLAGWRRRGLGVALLRASFVAFRRHGERCVGLGVDAGNATGAIGLYERVGMRVVFAGMVFWKELRAARAS